TKPPVKRRKGVSAYYYKGELLVCGTGTYDVIERLRELRGRFNKELSCWVIPVEKESEVLKLITEEMEKTPRELEEEDRVVKLREEEDIKRIQRMKQREVEEQFIPNI